MDLPNTELVVWQELSDAPTRTYAGPMAKPYAAAPLGIDTMQASFIHMGREVPRPPFGSAHVS